MTHSTHHRKIVRTRRAPEWQARQADGTLSRWQHVAREYHSRRAPERAAFMLWLRSLGVDLTN